MKKIVLICCVYLITFGFVSISYAKTFYLKDGSIVEGTVIKEDEEVITVKDATIKSKNPNEPSQEYLLNASQYFIKKDEIEKIEESKELSSPESPLKEANITEGEAIDETIAIFEKVKDEIPDNPASWEALGFAYEQKEDLDKAIEYYKKAIEIDENYYMSYVRLAGVYKKLGMKEEAKKEYKKALLLIDEKLRKNKAKLDTLKGGERESFKKWTLRLNENVKDECELALEDLENSTNCLGEKITLETNDADARANIGYFTLASEYYKTRKGEYAQNINDLLANSNIPFVTQLLNSKEEIGGFKYSIEFSSEGYKIIATPLECGKSGSKVFIGETGEKRTEEDCK